MMAPNFLKPGIVLISKIADSYILKNFWEFCSAEFGQAEIEIPMIVVVVVFYCHKSIDVWYTVISFCLLYCRFLHGFILLQIFSRDRFK